MDLRHLELLRELADRGTITAVAEATFRSPSAVSQQLQTAERAFGVALVEPDGRRLRLTAAGRLLALGAADVATTLARLQHEVDALQGEPSGLVRVAALPSAAEFLLPPVLRSLAGGAVTLTLTDDDVAEADFGRRTADHDVVIGHTLAEVPAGTERLSVLTLAREPLEVAVPADHRLGYPFDTVRIAIDNRSGQPLQVVQRIRDNRVVESLVASGEGCALLPRFTTLGRPGVVTLPLADVRSVRTIVALGRPDRWQRAAVRLVLDALAQVGATMGDR
jgi:DNA-binding transcriptional LysR family regulator